ncbi:hypothetical protein [Streptomyces sp. NPDC091268]|uniref:hypothetical protein n=1 Tax=Streptomyces sp. NPDC091268 TaxID=3365979 RepID=UPI0037F84EF3
MRKKPRVTARAATLALLPALLLAAAGCGGATTPAAGGHPDPKDAAGAPGAPGGAGAASGAAKPRAGGTRLERSAMEQGDLPDYQVSAQGKNPNAPDGQPQADRKACQPLADVMGDEPDPAARATVNRGIGSRKQVGLAVSASVSSYAASDAEALIARLKDAVAACGTGFSATVQKQTGSYRDVRAAAYGAGGDESVSWTTTVTGSGASAPVHVVVVRQADTIVRLMALDVTGADQKVEVPHEVADKQLEKVRAAR